MGRRICASLKIVRRDSQGLFDTAVGLFNRGEFFACHEVFEEIWTGSRQPERWFLQSLIHFAVGLYHHQRGNRNGAVRQLRKGLWKIEGYVPEWGGVRAGTLAREVRRCLTIIEDGGKIEEFPKIEQSHAYRPGPPE